MYSQSFGNNTQQSSVQSGSVQEQDWGNLLLSELKRTAREYTTAALEATHPAIRQTFQSLAQTTMQDQASLYDVLSQLNGYGSVKMASPQEVQQELQQQVQKAEQLQSLVQQAIQGTHAQAAQATAYQQQYPANTAFQATSYPPSQLSGGSSFGQHTQGYAPQGYSPNTQNYSNNPNMSGYNSGYGNTAYTSNAGSTINSGFGYTTGSNSPGTQSGYMKSTVGSAQQSAGSSFSSRDTQDSHTGISESHGGNSYNWTANNSSAGTSTTASTSHGGNSFDWTASEETEAGRGFSASADKATGHSSKYL